ncbi:MAG TPA: hypothetical protein PKV33_00070 [Methanothrix sp.]|nr:hypothetical protein [Methanothrix sp.]
MNLFINEKQFEFWKLRRARMPNISIATNFGISRQAVSKAIISMDRKVETALCEMAAANRINIIKSNPQLGVLFGRSVPFSVDAIIFVSGKHGLQVWYEHDGDCKSCDEYAKCIELLWDFSDELGIELHRVSDPTKMAEELFAKLKEMV